MIGLKNYKQFRAFFFFFPNSTMITGSDRPLSSHAAMQDYSCPAFDFSEVNKQLDLAKVTDSSFCKSASL